jgi:GTP cyclohydrolase I
LKTIRGDDRPADDALRSRTGGPHWPRRPTRAEAEEAVRTLLAWAGDDPDREGLRATPQRVAEAYLEYFSGYGQDPVALIAESVIEDATGYDDIVMLKDIPVLSHCEHHVAPFMGRAFVAYLPGQRLTGLSRLARVVDALARRLQTQEALTAQIATALERGLEPRGVAVLIEAEHQCIAARGIRQAGLGAITTRFTGAFDDKPALQARFLALAGRRSGG